MSKDNLFEVIGEGVYEVETDDLFLPDISPEELGWPDADSRVEWENDDDYTRDELYQDYYPDDWEV